jgi:protein TonB
MTALPFPNPNPQGVLPQGTIPFSEFGKFGGGANQVRLLIGADGKVTSCAIYAPKLSQALNEKICSLATERGSFQPAKDASGQPMASVWMGSPLFLGPPLRGFGGGR